MIDEKKFGSAAAVLAESLVPNAPESWILDRVEYGAKVSCKLNSPVAFPDFIVTFVGKSPMPPPYPAHQFNYYFIVSERPPMGGGKEAEQTVVQWSLGFTKMPPAVFRFRGKCYALSRGFSEDAGYLEEDELVITRMASLPEATLIHVH